MRRLEEFGQEMARLQEEDLQDSARRAAVRNRLLSRPQRRSRWWSVVWNRPWMVGAAAAACAALWWWSVASHPLEFTVGEQAVAGTTHAVLYAHQEPVPLRFSDGSTVALARGASVRVRKLTPQGARVQLEQGRVDVSVTHLEQTRWSFEAGPYTVHVIGTRFSVRWRPFEHALELQMKEGVVEVEGPGVRGRRVSGKERLELVVPERERAPRTSTDEEPTPTEEIAIGEEPPSAERKATDEEPPSVERNAAHQEPPSTESQDTSVERTAGKATAFGLPAAESGREPSRANDARRSRVATASSGVRRAAVNHKRVTEHATDGAGDKGQQGAADGAGGNEKPAVIDGARSKQTQAAADGVRNHQKQDAARDTGADEEQGGAGVDRKRASVDGVSPQERLRGASTDEKPQAANGDDATPTEPDRDSLPDWEALVDRGAHKDAVASLDAAAFDRVLRTGGSSSVLKLGHSLRYVGDVRADQAYRMVRRRFAGTDAAAVSAFVLGRLSFHRGDATDAVRWFETYLRERPSGRFSEQAAGRLMEAYRTKNDLPRAREAARSYLHRFPNGAYAELARTLVK